MTDVVVAGGDARDIWLCRFLQARGYRVRTWGFRVASLAGYRPFDDPPPTILIGPMTGIDARGNMQAMDGVVAVTPELLAGLGPNGTIAAGLIADSVREWAQGHGLRTVEYRKEASFMWLNAVPTAEGALKAAIGLSGNTVYRRPLAIIGFGRVGMVLGLRLQAYGADVHIFERSPEKRAMARALGFPGYPLTTPRGFQVDGIYNTVPAPVLDQGWVVDTAPAWIIDLASEPGGLTPAMHQHPALRGRYQSILGIPGQIAPIRAAEIIWETLSLVLE